MFPMMGPGGIPQGVLMSPSMLNQNPQLQQQQQQQQQTADKTKAAEQEKQKQSGKKEEKKETFPPQVMQSVDLN
jgi:fructose-1,6-bisphosphatase/sedoheptulose 1,7-bisphosphatase-like protein